MVAAPVFNLHSRLVFWLKILLPLVALALLSTLFLFGRNVRPDDAIPYADGTVADRVKEPRLTDAVFAGVTEDGSTLKVTAADARPGLAGSTHAGSARQVYGRIQMPDGSFATVTSPTAQLDQVARMALLQGGVTLFSSTDYTVKSIGMSVGLNETDVTSLGPVTGTGPAGTLEAQKMHLGRKPGGGYLLDFTGGVHLVYTPAGGL